MNPLQVSTVVGILAFILLWISTKDNPDKEMPYHIPLILSAVTYGCLTYESKQPLMVESTYTPSSVTDVKELRISNQMF